jgi:LmbE family N-acetylglucosaminyl deacetylase
MASSVFTQPTALPLYSIDQLFAERVLVVAPHPDDECLGCGGAIELLRAQGCDVQILVISDGAMSHPNSQRFPAPALRAVRAAETRAAMALLGVQAEAIRFLGLPDGAIPTQGAEFDQALQQCRVHLTQVSPQLIFLPQRHDPHPDHRASWQLIWMALQAQNLMQHSLVRLLEYPIWNWDINQRYTLPEDLTAWRLDIRSSIAQKVKAIQVYRSQVSDLIDDDPAGFRLSTTMLDYFYQPWEVYFEEAV